MWMEQQSHDYLAHTSLLDDNRAMFTPLCLKLAV